MKTAVVFGGGHNALILAALLAEKGLEVTLVEALDRLGGAVASALYPCGCELNLAANTLRLLDREVLRLVSKYTGADWSCFLTLPDPQLVLRTFDATLVIQKLPSDKLALHLASQMGESSANLLRFFNDISAAAKAVQHLWTHPDASFRSFAAALDRVNPSFSELFLKNSLKNTVEVYFQTESAKLLFGGMSSLVQAPYDEPETAFCLLYLSSGDLPFSPDYGIPVQGMGEFSRLLIEAAMRAGVCLRTGERVITINCNCRGVESIITSKGISLQADYYISGFSPVATELLLPQTQRNVNDLHPTSYGTGCARLNCLSTRGVAEAQLQYNGRPIYQSVFCGGLGELSTNAELARCGIASEYPYIELTAPTLVGANSHCDNHVPVSIYALYFPYEWCKAFEKEAECELILCSRVKRSLARWLPDLADDLQILDVLEPLTLERHFGMWRGDVDHGSFREGNTLDRRGYGLLPHGSTRIPNLFNCSSGTHPGGLVSGRPAITCARTIMRLLVE